MELDQQIVGLVLGIALGAGAVVLGLLHDGYDAKEKEHTASMPRAPTIDEEHEFRLDSGSLDETGPHPTVCDTKEREERS
jgi:hypothetical protein